MLTSRDDVISKLTNDAAALEAKFLTAAGFNQLLKGHPAQHTSCSLSREPSLLPSRVTALFTQSAPLRSAPAQAIARNIHGNTRHEFSCLGPGAPDASTLMPRTWTSPDS
jgi:hypothetical protein